MNQDRPGTGVRVDTKPPGKKAAWHRLWSPKNGARPPGEVPSELVWEGSPRLPHPAARRWQTCLSGTDAAVLTARAALRPEATPRTGAGAPSNGASPTDVHTPTAGCLPSAASHLTMPVAGWGLGQTTTGRGMGPTLGREPQDSSCLSVSPKRAREQPGSRPPASQGKGTYRVSTHRDAG